MKCEKVCSFSVLNTIRSGVNSLLSRSIAYSSQYWSGLRVESFWHISRLVSVENDIFIHEE